MKKKIRNEKRRQGIWTANRQRILFVSEGKKETVRENKKETESQNETIEQEKITEDKQIYFLQETQKKQALPITMLIY